MPPIKGITAFPLSIPFIDDPPTVFRDSWGVQLYVKVELGDSVGWGEVLVYGSGVVDAYMGVLNDVVVPATVGKNIEGVEDIVALTNELEKLLFTGGLCGIVTGAMGGLEMALWDALGKQLGRPVSDMLGGRTRTRIPVYASFPRYSNVDQIIKAVGKAVERGFTMVKLHQRPDESLDAVKAIRGKFGSDVAIALDLNAAFNSPGKAIKFLNEIHGYEPRWVEEPTWPPNDKDSLRAVARESPVPIAAGENEYYVNEFKELAEAGVSYIQPDISKVGGVARFFAVVRGIKDLGKYIAPHHRPHRSVLAHAFTLHVASAVSEVTTVEWPLAWLNELYDGNLEVRNGEVDVAPLLGRGGVGLGVMEDALTKYKYERKYSPLLFH
ncbi:hypothetical protein GCM10007981_03160 [Thermocladium modestius]|uniref:Mandelate racemase/muconate lactonizing enzyme C-terminal domain-containing protein n=1 Tax=Thermocladium modestius TaxID=62609 RepID=A0A830GSW3_9CREN|nr:mandelate racemase/muconate lactonizing enzyme family protein [Thermocladium modestius]GGP19445.1 hypothetical protein GCM10007981_03160 [Thermocladium modestius]